MKNKIIKNIPNMITISRISASFLACIMFILGNFPVSLGFYVYAACSDAVDGYFARKLNATSELGRKLDAISDKLFVLSLIFPSIFMGNYLMLIPLFLETKILSKSKNSIMLLEASLLLNFFAILYLKSLKDIFEYISTLLNSSYLS